MIYHTVEYSSGTFSSGTFRDLEPAVLAAVRACEGRKCFNMIAVQGVSGMAIGFPLAVKLGIPIVVVRKPDEDSHSAGDRITGEPVKGKRCLFVDDFVSMGQTRARVRRAVELDGGKLTAEYMSRDDAFRLL
jgi:adenine/guanine phosphoribosyltransferase-like PRPP-binding protein